MVKRADNAKCFRARPDLQFSSLDEGSASLEKGNSHDRYTVKDPLSLEYFMLRRREYFLLRALQTPKTLAELRESYLRQYPRETLSQDELLAFCSAMHASSLLTTVGNTANLVRNDPSPPTTSRLAWLAAPLACRLPGIDPTPVLQPLAWIGSLVFNRLFFAILVFVGCLLLLAVPFQMERLLGDLSRLVNLSHPQYLVAAVLAIVLVKSWHELGHGLACQRLGGECREMGVLLLAMIPCLYCDVSDSWTFTSRWRRALVAVAGVYFELILAAAALAAWLVLAPGFVSHLALYVTVAASISTLAMNANPLVRFDGYYLLADLWGVPNLHQQSRQALFGPVVKWIQGGRLQSTAAPIAFDAPRPWLAAYAAFSSCYLIFVLSVILWSLHQFLSNHGFSAVGDLLVASVLLGLVIQLTIGGARLLAGQPFANKIGPSLRLGVLLALVGAAAWMIGKLEFEQSLKSPCRLESTETQYVTAPVEGEIVTKVSYGQRVTPGETLVKLRDADLQLQWLRARTEEIGVATEIDRLRQQAATDPELFSQIGLLETRHQELKRRVRTLRNHAQQFQLEAQLTGTVLRPPPKPEAASQPGISDQEELDRWTDAALDTANQSCSVLPGDPLCLIAGEQLEAVLLLKESDSNLAQRGDPVRLVLDRHPSQEFWGTVEEIALTTIDDQSSRPLSSTDLASETPLRRPLDLESIYRVRVRLDIPEGELATDWQKFAQHGTLGQARIVTGRETVLDYLTRHARQLFHFQ